MHRYTPLIAVALVLDACSPPLIDRGPDSGATTDGGQPDADTADAGLGYDVFVQDGLDEDIAARFRSADTAPVTPPEILYPESGALVPPNLVAVDVHFRATIQQAFEITFAQGRRPSVVVYVGCAELGGGCVFQPWPEVWSALAARRFAGPYAIRVRALAGEEVTAPSEPVVLELADEPVHGALYYLAHDLRGSFTGARETICEYELGLEQRSSDVFLEPSRMEPEGLSSWHVVSRDGTRVAVTRQLLGAAAVSETRLFDVATGAAIGSPRLAEQHLVPRFGPGTDLLVSSTYAHPDAENPLRIVSGTDGAVLREWAFGPAHNADWSADGERIVFDLTVGTHPWLGASLFVFELSLLERSHDGEWGPRRVLPTPDMLGPYHPSFAPDSDWIAFGARDLTDQDEHGVYAPRLLAMRISDGRLADLRRAQGTVVDYFREAPELYEVRWVPSPFRHHGRLVYWLTFRSTRGCGLLPLDEARGDSQGAGQIWMAAFDPRSDADDPSRPAFRIPAQRWVPMFNSRAEWALSKPRPPCDDDDECSDGARCEDGFCFEAPE